MTYLYLSPAIYSPTHKRLCALRTLLTFPDPLTGRSQPFITYLSILYVYVLGSGERLTGLCIFFKVFVNKEITGKGLTKNKI